MLGLTDDKVNVKHINEPLTAKTSIVLFHKDVFGHFSFNLTVLTCSSVFCVGLIWLFDAEHLKYQNKGR